MAGLVVITRPHDEAEALSDVLQAGGYETLVEPMLRIVEIRSAIPNLNAYQALAFTSVNGVRLFSARSAERAMPAFAVGSRTAESLRSAGFIDVRIAAGDATALAAMIRAASPGISRVLHISGTVVAHDLAVLVGTAVEIDRLVVYGAINVDDLSADLVAALYACTVGTVLFFSPRTAETFGTLIGKLGLTEMIGSCSALCLSSQVAARVANLPWKTLQVAMAPTAESLLSLLPPAGADRG